MAFCRWSSDDFKCDVYAYENINGGFTIHIAENRIVGDIPGTHDAWIALGQKKITPEAYLEKHRAQMKFLETAKHEPIGLPLDGISENVETLADLLARLKEIREIGYHIPNYVFTTIEEELNGAVLHPEP